MAQVVVAGIRIYAFDGGGNIFRVEAFYRSLSVFLDRTATFILFNHLCNETHKYDEATNEETRTNICKCVRDCRNKLEEDVNDAFEMCFVDTKLGRRMLAVFDHRVGALTTPHEAEDKEPRGKSAIG